MSELKYKTLYGFRMFRIKTENLKQFGSFQKCNNISLLYQGAASVNEPGGERERLTRSVRKCPHSMRKKHFLPDNCQNMIVSSLNVEEMGRF